MKSRVLAVLLAIGAAVGYGCAHGPKTESVSVPPVDLSRIKYDQQCFTIDGKDTFLYSGSFHYFRCPKLLLGRPLSKNEGCRAELRRDLRRLELARAAAARESRRFFQSGHDRPERLARHGHQSLRVLRHPPPRPLHLRRMGWRRISAVASHQAPRRSQPPLAPWRRSGLPRLVQTLVHRRRKNSRAVSITHMPAGNRA